MRDFRNEAITLKKQRVDCPEQCKEDIHYCRYSVTEVLGRSAEQDRSSQDQCIVSCDSLSIVYRK